MCCKYIRARAPLKICVRPPGEARPPVKSPCVRPNGSQVHCQDNDEKVACPFFSKYVGSCSYKCLGFMQRNQYYKNLKTAVFAKLGRRTRNAFCEKFNYSSYNKKADAGPDQHFQHPVTQNCQVKDNCKKNRSVGRCHECKKSLCGKCTASTQRVCTSCK